MRLPRSWRPRWNLAGFFRLLIQVLRTPFFLPLITFFLLYNVAYAKWCIIYDCNGIWKPAFPPSWRTWALALAVAPINAAIWLVWMLGWEAAVWWFRIRRVRSRVSSRAGSPRISGSGDDAEDQLLPGSDRTSRSVSPNEKQYRSRHGLGWEWFWWFQVGLYVSIALAGLWQGAHYEHPNDIRYRPVIQQVLADKPHPYPNGYGKGEKIYIAAAFYNNEQILPYWTNTFLTVISYLGTQNVFVSIVESSSTDRSPELLSDFATKLSDMGVAHRVLVRDDTIVKPGDLSFNNRINFLAAIRNRVMEPLVENGGYSRVLFSNDVYVEPESVIELLETADGQYDMACAMDFNHFGAYDAWVLRDRLGHLTSTVWPFFIDAPSIKLMHEDAPVPVFSCWNGMVVFAADPLLPISLRSNTTLSTSPLPRPIPPTHPAARDPSLRGPSPALTPPLRFRSADRDAGECFSSESFLLPYDMRRVYDLQRIYVNPRVVTSYSWHFYIWFKWVLGHPLVRWWVRDVYDGAWMERAKMIVGDEKDVWVWDGGDCHPWW
ncbi:uncharacterized protein FIBRA_03140 [Fibroporia radiculosa]|uniref:Glycosyltransferase family 69 protein n=1 Tax=Fibroporia radiculosa TaxID=599839 RepID=J4HVT9_9APHY|nr:uncharacterized protein FIBRA_03140 [Fibroporia radiculosa]CCM01092.1 predicted protein [Fibroporia radiculosa]